MRRLIALVLFALLLAGCGSSGSGSSSLADVKVSGKADQEPKLTFDQPFTATKTERKVLTEGKGAEVKVGDKVTVNYVGVNGKDGTKFDSSFEEGKKPADFTLQEGSLIKGFVTGLTGVKVGSRVLVAITPADGYGPAGGQPSAGIGPEDSLLFVIDVLDARQALSRATGASVEPTPGMPTVTLAENGEPTISMPKGPPPAETATAQLITGEGVKTATGQTLTVNVVVAAWSDGRVIESSWKQGAPAPLQLGGGQLLPELDAALTGQTVGSQLLVIIPQPDGIQTAQPEATPSASPSESPSPTPEPVKPDALVFVIDILDAGGA